ncbi:MAG: type II and III secretion system protein family protein, partial [Thermoanaerobaculia bacterium]
ARGRRGWVGPKVRLGLVLAALVATCLGGPASAERGSVIQANGNVGLLTRITLVQGKSRNLRVDVPFAIVEVADKDIVDAATITDRQLFLVGKKIGVTNILLYDETRRLIGAIDVDVKLDTRALGSRIREGSGADGIEVNEVYGKLVLSGDGGDSQTVERAMSVAQGLAPGGVVNALKVKTPQQVMLQVRFVEANRNAARALGVRWEFFRRGVSAGIVGRQDPPSKFDVGPGQFAFGPAGNNDTLPLLNTVPVVGAAAPFATVITEIINSAAGKLDVVLSALEGQRVIRKLAEPNLIAMSGETAEFLAGGEFPIPVVSAASAGTLPTVTVQFKEFGVKLNFAPTVLSRGVISLKLYPEVSELDFTNAITTQGFLIPSLTTRRARTTIELRDGQSFAIAGLLQSNSTRNQDQVPWLGSVPVLGALFRSSEYQAQETELVVIVTPHIIKPVPPDRKLKTPLDTQLAGNDLDLFLNGQAEVPKQPPFATDPLGGFLQNLFGGQVANPPGPVPVALVEPAIVPAPDVVPAVAAASTVGLAQAPVQSQPGAVYFDPATGNFVDAPRQ